jgi:hypothetical protein
MWISALPRDSLCLEAPLLVLLKPKLKQITPGAFVLANR